MSLRRRRREPEPAHHDRWLVSYADLITLLFAFFTVLYAISTVDKTKAQHAAESMAAALRTAPTPSPPQAPIVAPPAVLAAEAPPPVAVVNPLIPLANELAELAKSPALNGRVQVSLTRRGVVVSLAEAGFFEVGRAEVRTDALPALDELAGSLRHHDDAQNLQLTVEGHTDDRPIHGRYRSNWELSTARATAVVARLVERHHYAPGRLAASGYGEWRPMAPNDTVEGRAKNRRVDVLVRLADGSEP